MDKFGPQVKKPVVDRVRQILRNITYLKVHHKQSIYSYATIELIFGTYVCYAVENEVGNVLTYILISHLIS